MIRQFLGFSLLLALISITCLVLTRLREEKNSVGRAGRTGCSILGIRLGDSEDSVIGKLGQPAVKSEDDLEYATCVITTDEKHCVNSVQVLQSGADGDMHLPSLEANGLGTISIGDSRAKVVQMVGNPDTIGDFGTIGAEISQLHGGKLSVAHYKQQEIFISYLDTSWKVVGVGLGTKGEFPAKHVSCAGTGKLAAQ